MIKKVIVASLLSLIIAGKMALDSIDPYYDSGIAESASGLFLYGKGNPKCDKNLPTFTVGAENLIMDEE